jgi:hypothetical protein
MDDKLKNAYKEWDKLCEEFERARDEQFEAYAVINGKFGAVARNEGGNPSDEELERFESANKRLDDVLRRMEEFVEANT